LWSNSSRTEKAGQIKLTDEQQKTNSGKQIIDFCNHNEEFKNLTRLEVAFPEFSVAICYYRDLPPRASHFRLLNMTDSLRRVFYACIIHETLTYAKKGAVISELLENSFRIQTENQAYQSLVDKEGLKEVRRMLVDIIRQTFPDNEAVNDFVAVGKGAAVSVAAALKSFGLDANGQKIAKKTKTKKKPSKKKKKDDEESEDDEEGDDFELEFEADA